MSSSDLPILFFRERHAPPPALPLRLAGRLSWQMHDRRGRLTADGEQSNLVLDSGLNLVASHGFSSMGQYLTVGTGSTAPAVGQVALTTPAARKSAPVVASAPNRIADGIHELTWTTTFDYAEANGNLTEWGASPLSTGNLFSRELFRDGANNPVPVTKTTDQKMTLSYTLRMTNTPVVPTAGNPVIDGVGAVPLKYVLHWLNNFGNDKLFLDRYVTGTPYSGASGLRGGLVLATVAQSYTNYPATTGGIGLTFPAYVNNSFQRQANPVVVEPGTATGTVYGFGIESYEGQGGNWRTHYSAMFDAGTTINKTASHRLTFLCPVVSWGR